MENRFMPRALQVVLEHYLTRINAPNFSIEADDLMDRGDLIVMAQSILNAQQWRSPPYNAARRREEIAQAAALLIAEIERLDRAEAKEAFAQAEAKAAIVKTIALAIAGEPENDGISEHSIAKATQAYDALVAAGALK